MGSIINTKVSAGLGFAGKTFYYVPFSLAVFRNLMVLPAVSNTLISNHAGPTTYRLLNSDNYQKYGPAGQKLFRHLAAVLGDDSDKYASYSRVCLPKFAMVRETIELGYDIVQAASNGDGT